MRTITREEWDRIPEYMKSMAYDQTLDWSNQSARKHWVDVRIGDLYAACDPKYLPEENKMPINMTVKEWEAVPEYWRASRMRSELNPHASYSRVFLTDDSEGRPHGSVHLDYWKHQSKPVQEITIAVWADGKFCPITVSPEEHAKECVDPPARYEIWERREVCYSLNNTRRVEMRPVVLP